MKFAASVSLVALALSGCAAYPSSRDRAAAAPAAVGDTPGATHAPAATQYLLTAEGARQFIAEVEKDLFDLSVIGGRAPWVNATYINDDTDALAAYFGTSQLKRACGTPRSRRDILRCRDWIRIRRASSTSFAAGWSGCAVDSGRGRRAQQDYHAPSVELRQGPRDPQGQGHHRRRCRGADGRPPQPAELQEIWQTWHEKVGRPMRQDYTRMVEIVNEGAKELGYPDTGAMWRSNYDMSPEQFSAMYDRLWAETKPLYDQLHCYTRTKLNQKYGNSVQPATGPIRADLLGNMWAQEWGNIYDVVAPKGAGDIGYDLTDLLVKKKVDPTEMVRIGERFYTSLGLAPLPQTFWQRSQIVRPEGREVVCHASAWDLDNKDDLRIKMCTKVNADDFVTIHHELGHNYYQRAYNQQPYLYLNGANDGFHEAIGDFIALSVTPTIWCRSAC